METEGERVCVRERLKIQGVEKKKIDTSVNE